MNEEISEIMNEYKWKKFLAERMNQEWSRGK